MRNRTTSHYRTQQLFIAIGLLLTLSLCTQAERLPVKVYTSADGLGSSFVNYLMRDSRGFMWFCTRDGLSRFDGARFITYRIGSQNAPPGIEGISETRDGSYWVTTTSGLYRFRRDDVLQPDATNGNRPTLKAEFISDARGYLLEDHSGNLWYNVGGLNQLEEKDGKVSLQEIKLNLPVPPGDHVRVYRMTEAADGSLWLNTNAGLVRRLPDGRLIVYRVRTPFMAGAQTLLADDQGRIWFLRELECYVLKPDSLESLANVGDLTVRSLDSAPTVPATAEKEIRLPEKDGEILCFKGSDFFTRYPGLSLYLTSDKHVWITTDRELIEFDGRMFHRFTTAQGLPASMSFMAEDSAGNLWVAGQTALIRLDRKGLTSYGEADGFRAAAIHAISEARDGTLYFADGAFSLSRFDGKQLHTTQLGMPPNTKTLWTSRYAFLDSRNEWWILTTEKLYRFSADNFQKPLATYTSRDGLKADDMFQIFEDRRGDIWVSVQPRGTANDGLARFERSKNSFRSFTEADGFPADRSVSSFAEDRNGNLWLGFYEGGVVRYANNCFTEINLQGSSLDGVITDLHLDRNGRLWLSSTSGGVSCIDDPSAAEPQFVSFTTDQGLSSNNIRTITEDLFGNIYLGTVRGIDRISPEINHIRHYSVSDGLAGDFVVDSHCDKNGVLWFATTNGLSRLMPTGEEGHAPPTIWLGSLRIAGEQQPVPQLGAGEIETTELSYTQNNLQMDFFGLDFHAGEILRYQYLLEGADTDWRAPTELSTVNLANLSPGRYRLLMRAINSDGGMSLQPASVRFRILPPIWQRWWFITLAALLVTAAIYGIFHFRINRLLEIERVRTRIAADLHDDIGASLSHIAVVSEVARHQLAEQESPLSKNLSVIARISREAVDSMSDIVWAVNPQRDHLYDLTRRMRSFASELLPARDITFRFTAPSDEEDIRLGADVRRQLFLIYKESVNNMARHSGCQRAEIDLHIDGKRLVLQVSDDGKGFETTNGSRGNGLKNMRKRAEVLGGEVEIISNTGTGTTILVSVPHHPTHKFER